MTATAPPPAGATHADSRSCEISQPSNSSNTVIIGSGVIGLATAYNLALLQSPSRHGSASVVDPSSTLCPGASGQAKSNLGDFGFEPCVEELGEASFLMHRQLASEKDGAVAYGYAPLNVWKVSPRRDAHYAHVQKPPGVDVLRPELPRWLNVSPDWDVLQVADHAHASHLDPSAFCKFLYDHCQQLGVVFHLGAKVENVRPGNGLSSFEKVGIRREDNSLIEVPDSKVVISAGPWSQDVMKSLFPESLYAIPLNSTNSAGNHLQVKTPGWAPRDDERGLDQVFLGDVLDGDARLDLTSYNGGTIYVGGYGAEAQELPKSAEEVLPQKRNVEVMRTLAEQFITRPPQQDLEIVSAGRCYRPAAMPDRPIIGEVPLDMLYPQLNSHGQIPALSRIKGSGLFINVGHNSDGVTLALGSGRVMAELVLGLKPSIDISGLGLDV
ncbi:MAG: hypothetical protein M1828_004757 [Chrysothrix sp. TS-e1954]|nr:MAG: hypothetical protein M1828_004757 [Chrysothrix sp. TS-e1954]